MKTIPCHLLIPNIFKIFVHYRALDLSQFPIHIICKVCLAQYVNLLIQKAYMWQSNNNFSLISVGTL